MRVPMKRFGFKGWKMDEFDLLLISLVNLGAILVQRRRDRINNERRRRRHISVRPINKRRRQREEYCDLLPEMKSHPRMFTKYSQIMLPSFHHLMDIANPSLTKRSPCAIEPEQQVALISRYPSGDKVPIIAFPYCRDRSAVQKIVKETRGVIERLFGVDFVRIPAAQEYLQIVEGFREVRNFLYSLGVINENHVDAQCPSNSETLYFDYHKRYGIAPMTVCNRSYKFTSVGIGSIGKNSDGSIYPNSLLNLENEQSSIPKESNTLSESFIEKLYCFVEDKAFPIGKHLVSPYLERYLRDRKALLPTDRPRHDVS